MAHIVHENLTCKNERRTMNDLHINVIERLFIVGLKCVIKFTVGMNNFQCQTEPWFRYGYSLHRFVHCLYNTNISMDRDESTIKSSKAPCHTHNIVVIFLGCLLVWNIPLLTTCRGCRWWFGHTHFSLRVKNLAMEIWQLYFIIVNKTNSP